MVDIKVARPAPVTALLYLREAELREGLELLFFAYRDVVREADALLAGKGLGRAHHRALHFIARQPGMTVGALLRVLKITKQSLSRVLRDLVGAGLVVQVAGERDRRQRLLRLTEEGLAFEASLFAAQRPRLAQAFRAAGPEAVSGFRRVLFELIDAQDRAGLGPERP